MINNNFLVFFSDHNINDLQNAHIFLLLRDFKYEMKDEIYKLPYGIDENTLRSNFRCLQEY